MHHKYKLNAGKLKKRNNYGFTIVELLVVIVVIGILAAILLASYTGITLKANTTSLQSDLANASKKLAMYYAEYGTYPTSINLSTGCPTAPTVNSNYCIKFNSDTTITYASTSPPTYVLTYSNGTLTYKVTPVQPPTASVSGPEWIVVGNQLWAKANLNVGTMVTGLTAQTNNGGTNIVEKYCYNDLEANCATYGALYQWDEAMKYSTVEGVQGVCITGSHIPSDNDWKLLEAELGMAQAATDATGWRGTIEGTKLKSGGSSGLNVLFAGLRFMDGSFGVMLSNAELWSSSESVGSTAWDRNLDTGNATVFRFAHSKALGFSVRCVAN